MGKLILPVILLLSFFISCSDSAADIARLVRNVNLEKLGVHLKLNDVPGGMYEKPFMIKFDTMLRDISEGAVMVKAYNIYTVGNHDKVAAPSIKEASNFLDPTSKFKDAWFGVYIILDDGVGTGRRFMLRDRNGRPDDLANLNDRSLLLLPELDQKIISWSSHQNQAGYGWENFLADFHFAPRAGTTLAVETITDRKGRTWRRLTGQFDTTAALTDTRLTDMQLFSSIRNYTGLPTQEVYKQVEPWHPIIITGSIAARYFACAGTPFWAVAYYNGSAFTTKQGKNVNTWEQTDLRKLMETMFERLDVDCVKK
jgi:hypothetical protein